MDAKNTVGSVMKFIDDEGIETTTDATKGRAGLTDFLKQHEGVKSISWQQYLNIDAAEKDPTILRTESQPREKILSVNEMVSAAS